MVFLVCVLSGVEAHEPHHHPNPGTNEEPAMRRSFLSLFRPRTIRRPATARLKLDVLEERCTPADFAVLSGGTLTVNDGSNEVAITQTGRSISVYDVNDGAANFALSKVKTIVVIGNGNDVAVWREPQHVVTRPVSVSGDWFDTHLSNSSLRSLARSEESDGTLDRNDMIALFNQVQANGWLSLSEYNDLTAIVGNGGLLNIPGYVDNLASKVIGYDRANSDAFLRDGHPPGQVIPNRSSQTLGLLVHMWFLGDRHPVASSGNDNLAANDYQYKPASGTLFGGSKHDQVDPSIIQQGAVGDCYLLAGLGEVALRSPQSIKDMFIDNGDGTWTVRFFEGNQAQYVTVDRSLPVDKNGNFVYANSGANYTSSSNVLWVALAEKAYAQLNASGWIGQDGSYSYNGMDGKMDPQGQFYLDDGINYGDAGLVMTQITGRPYSGAALFSLSAVHQLVYDFQHGELIAMGTPKNGSIDGQLFHNHAYLVVAAYTKTIGLGIPQDYVVVQNPYANADPNHPQYVTLTALETAESFNFVAEVSPATGGDTTTNAQHNQAGLLHARHHHHHH
jgi:hypothetical protein